MSAVVVVLNFAVLGMVFFALLVPRWRQRARLLALGGRGGRHFPVAAFVPEDLGRWQAVQRKPIRGLVSLDASGAHFRYETGAAQVHCLDYPSGAYEVQWLGFGGFLSAIPSMVRLSGAAGTRYLRVQDPLGGAKAAETRALFDALARKGRVCPALEHPVAATEKNGLGLAAAAMVLALLGVLYGAVHRNRDLGPSLAAAIPGGGFVAANRENLFRFDAEGSLLSQRALADWGVGSDGLAALTSDSQGRLWFGDYRSGSISRCDDALNQCERLSGMRGGGPFRRTFKFLPPDPEGRIYAVDTAAHALVLLDASGRELSRLSPVRLPLCFPNSLAVDAKGSLYVADTRNRRVLALGAGKAPFGELAGVWPMGVGEMGDQQCRSADIGGKGDAFLDREFNGPLAANPRAVAAARAGRTGPIALRQDEQGYWWVLLVARNDRDADLLRFSRDFSRPVRIALPDDADPTDLALSGGQVLVTDPNQARLWRVDRATLRVSPFGDASFAHQMDAFRGYESRMSLLYRAGLVVMAVAMGLLALVALRMQRRQLGALAAAAAA